MPQKFNLEEQFQLYLQRVGLNPAVMNAVQLRETKNAFVAGIGQLLMYQYEITSADIPDEVGGQYLEDIKTQVGNFFMEQLFNSK